MVLLRIHPHLRQLKGQPPLDCSVVVVIRENLKGDYGQVRFQRPVIKFKFMPGTNVNGT